jgi:hypothetical protein
MTGAMWACQARERVVEVADAESAREWRRGVVDARAVSGYRRWRAVGDNRRKKSSRFKICGGQRRIFFLFSILTLISQIISRKLYFQFCHAKHIGAVLIWVAPNILP